MLILVGLLPVVRRNCRANPMSKSVSAKNNIVRSIFMCKKEGPGRNQGRNQN